jgi:hypothetical protein
MIKTVYQLLYAIKDKGIKEIEPYLNIQHNPTIGDMYEGLTKELMDKAIFKNFDIRVTSGKIKNINGVLSKQIDCMIVIGDGERIPFTKDYIYEVNNVIVVIEVKKNLFSDDLDSAYYNLKSVADIAEPNRSMEVSMLRSAFKSISKIELPEDTELCKLSYEKQMIYHTLVMECFLPARIIFGYEGFKNEHSLRKAFVDYIAAHASSDEKIEKGFGAVSLPSLIICGENSLVKTNGIPYVIGLNTDDWVLYASYNKDPLLLLLEIIWTRLTFLFHVSSDVFGEDLKMEALKPLLIATPVENRWQYNVLDFNKEELLEFPTEYNWQPTFLSDIEFYIMNKLCNDDKVDINDIGFQKFLEENNENIDDIISHLSNDRLVYLYENQLKLLTEQCQCIVTPKGFVAGENKDGRLSAWVLNEMKNK